MIQDRHHAGGRRARVRCHPLLALIPIFLLAFSATPAPAAVSLAGVHWYSGDSAMLDSGIPAGERGWNVETIFNVTSCDGNPSTDPEGVRVKAQRAKDHGLVNIIRIDYQPLVAVPASSGQYMAWSNGFINCVNELASVASHFAVGNEPNIEGNLTAQQYASAFNHLWGRKSAMPAATQLLAVHLSPFTDPNWMSQMSTALSGVDGFAFHTGGARPSCQDPRVACSWGGWSFDGGFRYYRSVIDRIDSRFWSRPVYLTEFNTFTGDPGSEPRNNYPTDWINKAFEEIRNYNNTRGSKPPVVALCWFVDEARTWGDWALRNLPAARADMGEEFRNPANRPTGGTTCPTATLAQPSDRWRLEIWNNRTFTGNPVERRYDAAGSGGFNFNWGNSRASNCTGTDNFAIRFTRSAHFATAGTYTFTTTTDDGVRLYIDGTLVLDRWLDQAPTTYTVTRSLSAGSHTLRVDYYENGGGASAALSWTGGGGVGNNATILEGQSSVPSAMNPGETRTVSVVVQNTGGTTWRAIDAYRLGANTTNTVSWGGWQCGGYNLGSNNARIYLCNDVPPGQSTTFTFTITAPTNASSAVFSARMVRDNFEWFGETQTWNVPLSGGNPCPSCPCNRTDNYCQHGPSTFGCPMTSPGGYCDPNGDANFSDGDWNRGWYEYQDYCM